MKKTPGANMPSDELGLKLTQLLAIFDSIEEPIYVADIKTHEVLFANKALTSLLGKDPVGGLCYQELQGLDSPCPFCTNEIILKDPSSTYRWEHENVKLNKVFDLNDRIIRWPDGREVRLEFAVNVTERKQAEANLRKRLAYEQLVSHISKLAMEADDLHVFQNECLKAMGETLDVSRIYIFEHHHETDTMNNTFEWIAEGVSPQKDELQDVSAADIPWWVEMLKNNRVINFADIGDIPDEGTKVILRPQGILSILVVPLFMAGQYYGFLGFDECVRHREWSDTDVELLQAVGRIMTGTLEQKRAETALRDQESLLHTVLDNLPVGIAVNSVSPEVNFEYMNDNFCRIYRTTREMLSHPDAFWEAVYEDPVFREEICSRVLADCANGDPEKMRWPDIPITRQGEQTTYVTARNINIPGQPLVVSTVIDVTENIRAKQDLADEVTRRRILVEQSRDGIVVLDQHGAVYEANRKYAEMLGYTPEEVLKLHAWDWDADYPREQIIGMLNSVDEKGDHFETRHRRKDGTFYDVEISTNGAEVGGQKLIFCVCRDITERKEAEAKMKKQLSELRQWYSVTLEREERILELKKEVDELLKRAGEKPKYGVG